MQDTQGYSLEPKDTGGKSLSINCLLTNNNFPLWIFKMKTVLDDENLIDISTDLETGVKQVKIISDPKKEKRAFRALTCNISEEVTGLIIHCQTAQEIWDTLMANYSGTSYARKLLGLQSLCSFRCKNADMRSNVAELRKVLTDTVVAAGSKSITFEEIATAMLINSLPTGFENARSQLTEKKVANLVAVEQKLIQEEEVLKVARQYADNSGFAGAAFGKGKCAHGWTPSSCFKCDPSKHPSKQKCSSCGTLGHRSSNSSKCSDHDPTKDRVLMAQDFESDDRLEFPKPFQGSALVAKEKTLRAKPYARSARSSYTRAKTPSRGDLRWVIDSGASKSLVGNKDVMHNYSNHYTEMSVADANADSMKCPGKGSIELNNQLKLENVVHCPDVALNLLSVAQLADRGLEITFDNDSCIVRNKKTKDVVLRGKREGGLYTYIQGRVVDTALATTEKKSSSLSELFHRRMGHINYQDLKLLRNISEGVILDQIPQEICPSCIQAKSLRR